MTRFDRLRHTFTKDMKLIEIGASYSPIIPKRDGWQTTIIDHGDRETLTEKYHALLPDGLGVGAIEEVDFVWQDGALLDVVPAALHGTFDGLIASHVGEHMPDLIGFFNAASRLLKPTGTLVLALPDKRLCFDFFQSLTSTGDLLNARGRSRHTVGTLYNHAAYFVERGGTGAWAVDNQTPFRLTEAFETVRTVLDDNPSDTYIDSHAWHFTPASFALLILELRLLGLIPWQITTLEPTDAIEFYVWLTQSTEPVVMPANLADLRLSLLRDTVMEAKMAIAQLAVPTPPLAPVVATPPPSGISVIIPLYNGGKYIEAALRSALTQSMPPIEIIVVDDGSTDGSPALVQAMAAQHPIIRMLSKTNGGQSSARNFGIRHSTGDLIALLDQDDLWYTTHLERLSAPFRNPTPGAELGWVYSDLDEIDTDGLMICHSFLSTLPTEHPKRSMFACLREDMFVLPSASLIARKAFEAVDGFDERLSGYEDDDLFLRLFRAGYANIFLNEALSKWRIYPESSSYSYRMRRSRAIYVRKLLDAYQDDVKRARFIHRDIILPRFYRHAVVEYRDALIAGDAARIAETHAELLFFVDQIPAKRRVMGRVLSMVRSQRAAQMAFAARGWARPLLRRVI